MKKTLLLLTLFFLAAATSTVFAQAKKNVFFEHFTNASCSPCAQQNPVFDTVIAKKNIGRILELTYHASWPGADPMNAYNAAEVQTRVNYYSVTGVPTMLMLGNKYNGSPAGVTQQMVNQQASEASPIRVKVKESTIGIIRNVTITVYTLDTVATGNYYLRAAVVEEEKNYTTAPGTNGEKKFPNVFRKAIPNSTGDSYTPAAIGDSVVYNYTYNLDVANWDSSKIYVIAWVQTDATMEVLNAGSTHDLQWEFIPMNNSFQLGTQGVANTFNVAIENLGDIDQVYSLDFNAVQPNDWTANYTINSISYLDTVTISVPAGTTLDITISVNPGNSAAIGDYSLSLKSITEPSNAVQTLNFNVIKGVTDLIINNDGWSGVSQTAVDNFKQYYIDGLTFAGNSSFASTSTQIFMKASKANLLSNVGHMYFNVGWSFPSFTDDNVAAFTAFLNNGGNLYVSGQDVGWDTWDVANGGNGTTNTQAFYANFLHANFLNDGTTATTSLNANTTDAIYGTLTSGPLANVYGGTNFFPDQISVTTGGTPTFYYGTGTIVAGIRSTVPVYKTAYLAPILKTG